MSRSAGNNRADGGSEARTHLAIRLRKCFMQRPKHRPGWTRQDFASPQLCRRMRSSGSSWGYGPKRLRGNVSGSVDRGDVTEIEDTRDNPGPTPGHYELSRNAETVTAVSQWQLGSKDLAI